MLALFSFWGLAAAQQTKPDPDVPVFGTTVYASSGLRGDIYFLSPGTEFLPRFTHRKPVGTIYTTNLNIPPRAFVGGFPGITDRIEWFAIDYTGRFWIEAPGPYRFALNSDDGSRLYLDGKLMIDNDGIHAPSDCAAEVHLEQGSHELRVSYFQGPRFQLSLILTVAPPGKPWQIFDTRNFAPSPKAASDRSSPDLKSSKKTRRVAGGRCSSW